MKNVSGQSWKKQSVLYLLSQSLSLFGSSLVQYALMWTITLTTQSGTMMMLFTLAGFIPTFIMSPFGGVWADRYDRKRLMILADGGIALATLVLAIATMSGMRELWLFFVIAAVRAIGAAIHQPASGAFLPQFVPAEKLARVTGIMNSVQPAIMLASPVLSGLLLSLVSLETFFFIDVGTAALAIAVLALGLRVPPHRRATEALKVSYFTDMKLGFRYIANHRYLVPFFAYIALILFMVAPGAFLTPLQVARTFGPEVWRLTGIEVVFSVGMMLGGFVIAAWGGFRNRMHSAVFATLVMGSCTVLLGLLTGSYWVYLLPMAVFGLGLPFFNTSISVMLQEHVEQDYLGRVYSVLTMLMTSLMPMGMIAFGPLAEYVSIEALLIVTGCVIVALSLAALLNRRLVEAGIPPAVKPVEPQEEGAGPQAADAGQG